ncbi:MAG: NAD(P)-dependent oxidoreductase [Pseudomonadota bacterium]
MTFGIIGLGRMGTAAALKISAADHDVVGWTRSGRAVDGVEMVASQAELVERSGVILLFLYDDAAVREVVEDLLGLDLTGRLIVDTSTVSPRTLRGFEARLNAAGASAVDAPISGGPDLIAAGNAGVFLGGKAEDTDKAAKVLSAIAAHTPRVGPLGSGCAAKAFNNHMLQVYMGGLIEATEVGRSNGLSGATMLEILKASPGFAPVLASRMDILTGENDRVGFPVSGGLKDNRLFSEIAHEAGHEAPGLELLHRAFIRAVENGDGDADLAMPLARLLNDG